MGDRITSGKISAMKPLRKLRPIFAPLSNPIMTWILSYKLQLRFLCKAVSLLFFRFRTETEKGKQGAD